MLAIGSATAGTTLAPNFPWKEGVRPEGSQDPRRRAQPELDEGSEYWHHSGNRRTCRVGTRRLKTGVAEGGIMFPSAWGPVFKLA